MKKFKHPMQPLGFDPHGVVRFKQNAVVRFLLDNSENIDMNKIVMRGFPQEDLEQFYQLIGYSFSGYCELSQVSGKSYKKAAKRYDKLMLESVQYEEF